MCREIGREQSLYAYKTLLFVQNVWDACQIMCVSRNLMCGATQISMVVSIEIQPGFIYHNFYYDSNQRPT